MTARRFPACVPDRGFTLIELLVVIVIIALLIGVLMPTLGQLRRHAQRTACMTTLQQIGIAWRLYLDDYRGQWPRAISLPDPVDIRPPDQVTLMDALGPYLAAPRAFACPSDDRDYFTTFGTSFEYLPGLFLDLAPENPATIAAWAERNASLAPIVADAESFHPTGTDPMYRQAAFHDGHVGGVNDAMQRLMEEQ